MSVHELEAELARATHPREAEGEAFFNHLSTMADRSGRNQALRRVAIAAARSAYQGALAKRPWPTVEGEFEQGELELGEQELGEADRQLELELRTALTAPNPGSALAEMEHLGHAAAEAASEQEAAEHFLPLVALAGKALLPLAAKALPKLAMKFGPKLISRIAPRLVRGVGNLARNLFRQPATRQLLRTVPRIARRTVSSVLRQAGQGRRITPTGVARTLARQTARTIGRPRAAVQAFRRSQRIDRVYHRQQARRVGRPPAGGGAQAAPGPMAPTATPMTPGVAYVPTAAGPVAVPTMTPMAPMVTGLGSPNCICAPPAPAVPTCPSCGR